MNISIRNYDNMQLFIARTTLQLLVYRTYSS